MAADVAGRVRTDCRNGVGATGRASRLRLQVSVCTNDVGECCSVACVLSVVHRPLLFGLVDLLKIGDAGLLSAALSSFDEVRDRNRHENADDQNNDHDLDERECAVALKESVHWLYILPDRWMTPPQGPLSIFGGSRTKPKANRGLFPRPAVGQYLSTDLFP